MDREAQARRDLGSTRVVPALGRWMVAACLVAIALPGLWQAADGSVATAIRDAIERSADPATAASRAAPGRMVRFLRAIEQALDESSPVRRLGRPAMQWGLTGLLASGNRKVTLGRDGWLFFRPELEALAAPAFLDLPPPPPGAPPADREDRARREAGDLAERAIGRLAARVEAAGARLWILPVPSKGLVAADRLAVRPRRAGAPAAENPSFIDFAAAWRGRGAQVIDLGADFVAAGSAPGEPLFLRTDTHWSPAGAGLAARRLAEALGGPRAPGASRFARAGPVRLRRMGDLAGALALPRGPGLALLDEEETTIRPVHRAGDPTPWRPGEPSDVLVLGDSYANVFGDPSLGWGEGGGLVEALAFHLDRPIERLAINGGGPAAAILALEAELRAGRDRLAGKRAVVFEFAARELTVGDWGSPPTP